MLALRRHAAFRVAQSSNHLIACSERAFCDCTTKASAHSGNEPGLQDTTFGARLLNRTTRSVSLTQAGTALLEAVAPAFAALSQGVESARTAGEAPAGLLRVTPCRRTYERTQPVRGDA